MGEEGGKEKGRSRYPLRCRRSGWEGGGLERDVSTTDIHVQPSSGGEDEGKSGRGAFCFPNVSGNSGGGGNLWRLRWITAK